MVYGCTLHLIDEESIRRELVPRLLETEREPERRPEHRYSLFGLRWSAQPERPILDLKRPPSTRRWRNMSRILEKRDPLYAARCLCEVAIRVASKELPYALVDQRDIVLSKWDECQLEGLPNLPVHPIPRRTSAKSTIRTMARMPR
jgi:hypothetical protein